MACPQPRCRAGVLPTHPQAHAEPRQSVLVQQQMLTQRPAPAQDCARSQAQAPLSLPSVPQLWWRLALRQMQMHSPVQQLVPARSLPHHLQTLPVTLTRPLAGLANVLMVVSSRWHPVTWMLPLMTQPPAQTDATLTGQRLLDKLSASP